MLLVQRIRRSRFGLAAARVQGLLGHAACAVGRPPPLSLGQPLRPCFIIGSGRSGTTLVRAILTAHGGVAIPPESYVIPEVIRAHRSLGFLSWPDLCRVVVGRFESHPDFADWETDLAPACRDAISLPPEQRDLAHIIDAVFRCYLYRHMPTAVLWGDKTPSNTTYVEWLDRVFPSALYIHVLRDGRDVVSSFMRTGIASSLGGACDDWRGRFRAARRLGRRVGEARYLEVRYEDLVTDWQREITRLCKFLQLEFRDAMLHHELIAPCLTDVRRVPHYANVLTRLNPSFVGNWRSNLSAADQALVERRLGLDLVAAGYGQDHPVMGKNSGTGTEGQNLPGQQILEPGSPAGRLSLRGV